MRKIEVVVVSLRFLTREEGQKWMCTTGTFYTHCPHTHSQGWCTKLLSKVIYTTRWHLLDLDIDTDQETVFKKSFKNHYWKSRNLSMVQDKCQSSVRKRLLSEFLHPVWVIQVGLASLPLPEYGSSKMMWVWASFPLLSLLLQQLCELEARTPSWSRHLPLLPNSCDYFPFSLLVSSEV